SLATRAPIGWARAAGSAKGQTRQAPATPEAAMSQGTSRTETTTTLDHRSVAAQAERDARPYQTREGRLRAKPLDWNSTLGQREPAAENAPAVEGTPENSEPARPNPTAKRHAPTLHPHH